MNYGPPPRDQLLPSCLPSLSWDQSMDLLGTIIPSQPAPVAAAAISVEIPSFMGDPLNSMHANRLMSFPSDAAFTERAAGYSCFSAGNYGTIAGQFGLPEGGKLSRVSSSKCLKATERPIPSCAQSEMGDGRFGSCWEDSSVTNPASAAGDSFGKKRKAGPKNKGKVAEENDLNAKKCRSAVSTGKNNAGIKPKEEQNCDKKNGKDNGSNSIEPPKDYIHVRARRGQATDSHSIAERVRREKISVRMKLLQDLVPGCNKITGKALMLDEIINYVQSLQRQVEFLSMKLATVNPRLDFNFDNLITKEFLANQANIYMSNSIPPTVANIIETNCPISQYESILHQSATMQSSLDMFGGADSQVGNLFDDVFHSVLQTGFGQNQQNQEIGVTSQRLLHDLLRANCQQRT